MYLGSQTVNASSAMFNLIPLSDEELIRYYITSQDNRYFDVLYARYCDKVYRKCLSFLKDPDLASDFTHDIFLKVITRISTFKGQSRFSTWLYSITYNYCLDQVRFRKKEQHFFPAVDELPDQEELNDDFSDLTAAGLRKAMSRMDPDEQSVLMLRFQDDFSFREIGDILKTSEGSARIRLARARKKLRKYYLETLALALMVLSRWAAKLPFRFF